MQMSGKATQPSEAQWQLAAMLEVARTSTPTENLENMMQAQERFMIGTATSKGQSKLDERLYKKRMELKEAWQRQQELKRVRDNEDGYANFESDRRSL
jgi:hypothetical protein